MNLNSGSNLLLVVLKSSLRKLFKTISNRSKLSPAEVWAEAAYFIADGFRMRIARRLTCPIENSFMKTLLITGASGFLGSYLCQLAQPQWTIYGTYHTHAVTLPGTTLCPIDLTDYAALTQLFQTVRPAAVLHTAAVSSPNFCQEQPDRAYQVNVIASWNIAGLCAEAGIPCAFTSSEQVFDGEHPPYQETDPVSPINHYGEQKAAAEAGMLERYPQVVICRMPLMFGASTVAPSFIQPWIAAMRSGKPLNLFTDEIRTPINGITAAKGLLLALEATTGILHLGGKEAISRYDFGHLLADVLYLPTDHLIACQQTDVKMAAPRPRDASLDSSRAFSLGFQPGTVRQEIEAIASALTLD